jgi:taurine dioxygenase
MTNERGLDMKVTPLTPHIGAEISGIDLTAELNESTANAIRSALNQHLVLFFREQDLTDGEHLRFASIFGAPTVFPATRARGLDEPLEWIEDTPQSPPKTDLWHTDVAFLAKPPDVGVLSMQVTPPVGGDTMWLSLYAAYEAVSPPLRSFLDTLEQDLHPGPLLKQTLELQFGSGIYERVAEEFAGARHPLVRMHPETKKPALFMCGRYVKRLVGLSELESDTLLELLRRGLDEPGIQCRWKWRKYDLAVWDERCTNHRALGDHYPAHRMVRRCTVGEGVPMMMAR